MCIEPMKATKSARLRIGLQVRVHQRRPFTERPSAALMAGERVKHSPIQKTEYEPAKGDKNSTCIQIGPIAACEADFVAANFFNCVTFTLASPFPN